MKNQVTVIYEKDSIKCIICDKPFIIPSGDWEGYILSGLINQIIGCNQYHVELIRKNGIVIDAGANMGVFSVFAAATHPNATIYAFEPASATFEILKENTKYYSNIKVFNSGLGEKVKIASLVITNNSGQNYIGNKGVPVNIETIDGLNLPVSFIKMDTEGYEANILKGAMETIKKYKPVIVMSAYHKINDETKLPALLNSIAAYNCELRHDFEEDFICKPIL